MNKNRIIAAGVGAVCLIAAAVFVFLQIRESDDGLVSPGSNRSKQETADGIPEYDYTEAPDHIGEKAIVKGTVMNVFTSKSGVTFLDFCKASSKCPFSAVIFKADASAFPDLKQYEREVRITGIIKSYQGKAEIVLDDPGQID